MRISLLRPRTSITQATGAELTLAAEEIARLRSVLVHTSSFFLNASMWRRIRERSTDPRGRSEKFCTPAPRKSANTWFQYAKNSVLRWVYSSMRCLVVEQRLELKITNMWENMQKCRNNNV